MARVSGLSSQPVSDLATPRNRAGNDRIALEQRQHQVSNLRMHEKAPMPNDLSVAVPTAPALRIARAAASGARTLLGLLLIGMVLVNVANAVCRYLFSVVVIGADEVLVY